ncbi:MAG: discoidin domain-containing protein [Bacteroidaceae bacterium]|nr:discoidin domain-containing protein [Bacteroidaceae bacterium]
MKKLKFLLILLMGMLVSTAFSQTDKTGYDYELDESEPLITDVEQLSSPWNAPHDFEGNLEHLIDEDIETYWHTNWNYGDTNKYRHYVQINLIEPIDEELISMKFTRRVHKYNSQDYCVADHVTKWSIYGSNDPDEQEDDWELLGTFDTPYNGPGEEINTAGFDPQGYQYLRVYADATISGKAYWHLAELQFYPCTLVDEVTSAKNELIDLYYQYEKYIDEFKANTGTAPGQYTAEAVEAFVEAMEAVDDADNMNDVDEIRELIELIKTSYQAVLDSVIPFTLADGYYRLRHALTFINSVPTGEFYDDGMPIYEDVSVNKYMYSTYRGDKIVARWSTPEDVDSDCPSLWKITNVDGLFDIVNCATDARFNKWDNSLSYLTMSKESNNLISVDLVENLEGNACVTLRVSTQDNGCLFHPLGHGISATSGYGTGVENDIIGWKNDVYRVSEWVFEPVDEDVALKIIEDYAPFKDHGAMVESFKVICDDAIEKLEIAKDQSYSSPLIENASQLSSPWSAPHDWEGNIAHLVDGNPLTYWHTNWNNNTDRQYLQIELNEPTYDLICMKFTRRLYNYDQKTVCTTNHPTSWSFYGSDDPQAEAADWELLAEFDTPFNAAGETVITDGFNPQGKKYLRLYGETNTDGNRYWHLAEFQLYPSPIQIIDPATSQYHMMGDVATTLEAILEKLKDIDPEEVTAEQYYELRTAYDAFIKMYVDPNPLRQKIEEVKDADNIIVLGTNPGFWRDNSSGENLANVIDAAKAYDEGGVYTAERSQAQIDAIDAAVENIKQSAIPVQTDKWYTIRFGTEEEYDKYNWKKDGNYPNYWIDNTYPDYPVTLGVYNEGNFGKYIAVAKREIVVLGKNDNGDDVKGNRIESIDKNEVALGQILHGIDLDFLNDKDMALFRFVNIGDSAYAIQNKATGLFLHSNTTLSVQPGLFTQVISGYGQNAFFVKTIEGKEMSPLHLAQNQTVLCTWGNKSGAGWTDADGRRGSFFVEEVEDVAANYTFGDFKMNFNSGNIYGCCFPVPITVKDPTQGKLWTVSGIERTPADNKKENVKITLGQITDPEVPAGRPFLYVASGEYYPEDGPDDAAPSDFSFSFNLVKKPQTDGYLKGTFDGKAIQENFLAVGSGHAEEALVFKDKDTKVGDNNVYITDINPEAGEFANKTDLVIEFNDNIEDGISTVLQQVAKTGKIYTIDGRMVSKSGNLNNLRNVQPGIYIVNGVKIVVK